MNETHDELAGVVDLFGALTRAELREALSELAFKRGAEPDESTVNATIERAIDAYALVVVDPDILESEGSQTPRPEGGLLVAGPTAFPSLPPDAEDLPHIMDVPRRRIDREAAGKAVRDQLLADVAAVEDDQRDRAERLLDVSYDLEAWAPIDADAVRSRLDELM